MQAADFVAEARERASRVWEAVHAHPFVRGIGDGTLSRSRWKFYLREDHAYLLDVCRLLGLAVARAADREDLDFFSRLLNTTVEVEFGLHREACARLGIDPGELEKTTPSLATTAHASCLMRAGYEGGSADVIAALLPCYAGYVEIAERLRDAGAPERLRDAGLPEQLQCRQWIDGYLSPGLREVVGRMTRRVNDHASRATPADRLRWLEVYSNSARFELLFLDTCWEEADWPGRLPGPAGAARA